MGWYLCYWADKEVGTGVPVGGGGQVMGMGREHMGYCRAGVKWQDLKPLLRKK